MSERAVMRPTRRSRSLLLLTGMALLLAACGGGGGGGGGATAAKLHALVINAAETDAAVTFTDADGVATEATVPTCSAEVLEFAVTDPFQISVDGNAVVDTAVDLPEGLPGAGETDLVVQVTIARDGTATFDRVRAGRSVSPPARSAYCPTLPG